MPRYRIADSYELPDDDLDEETYEGAFHRRRRRSPTGALLALGVLIAVGIGAASAFTVIERQERDAFCLACHTAQHRAYVERAQSAIAGALAPDLSSYHYQSIHGAGGELRCIDCHRGNGGTRHRVETLILSAELTALWLAGRDDQRLEKTAITTTVTNGITRTVAQTTLGLRRPHLTNEGCVTCHQAQLLIAGAANHMHNTLPAAYEVWKRGAPLTAPKDEPDPQAIIAMGLVRYETTVQCANCHQAHRSSDAARFLDLQGVVKPACEQCHRETGQGPAEVEVTIAEE
ncbi:MAG: hypothetical protein D6709_12400 [Chloroflexi bacterium]|jgi:mono/diheme cytochrome c family protein|uniref:Uncharacterized protein n=1 Tax=Candidatus Thermofonsia Clade 3 bacterium TaxID=2364212 RepID=A0A2M8QFE3_9CHLR|nr:hypothetical protein [Candidatus Roseilinea sp. NK_OTU-006]PJF48509.1 MAG: hypothetical protein CUN48_02980 [Candidatus Thermofonsia Clade 3 bacterium]RMG62141.1 MAG: hypothetical protein D6709_12400 [Chloroflexota bacterium]